MESLQGLSRREFLQASVGAACMTSSAFGASPMPGAIDVHHHILPPGYLEIAREQIARSNPAMLDAYDIHWTPTRSLDEMDRSGVAYAMASVSAPGVWFGDERQGRALARMCNDFAAELKAAYPRRFGAFAAVPLPDVRGSLVEIERALDALKLDGIGVLSSYNDRWIGDAAFAPVFDELNRRGSVVYVHPTAANCCVNTLPQFHSGYLEYPFDTTRAIASLLYSGTIARCPSIRFIFSHGGGALGSVNARLAAPAGEPQHAARIPSGVQAELRKLYYDTATVSNRPAFLALAALVPMTQILFGSDYPFGPPLQGSASEVNSLGLSERDLARVRRENALALWPGIAKVAG